VRFDFGVRRLLDQEARCGLSRGFSFDGCRERQVDEARRDEEEEGHGGISRLG
jgi:hypothetical protein